MSEGVQHNLDRFNRALRDYARLGKKTPEETLAKQGGKLAYALNKRLKGLAPKKGSVRAERLAALKAGEGVRVRDTARRSVLGKYQARQNIATRAVVFGKKGVQSVRRKGGRRLNLMALMIQRELSIRESARAFLSVSARYPRVLRKVSFSKTRFGVPLSDAGLSNSGETLTFHWDGAKNALAANAATGMNRPRSRAMIAYALRDVTADIRLYINRKQGEIARKVGLA